MSRLIALAMLLGLLASAANAASPAGLWMTASRDAVVRIAPCGPDVCGTIAGTVLGPNDPSPRTWTGAPQCGLTIFRMAPANDGSGSWNGSILDPRDGSEYSAQVTLDSAGNVVLRGYLLLPIFGESQTWTPYNGPLASDCRIEPGQIAGLAAGHSVTTARRAS